MPEIAAQAYRLGYRIEPRLELARRAVELYQAYLDKVKRGGRVADAADSLGQMETEVRKLVAAGAQATAVSRRGGANAARDQSRAHARRSAHRWRHRRDRGSSRRAIAQDHRAARWPARAAVRGDRRRAAAVQDPGRCRGEGAVIEDGRASDQLAAIDRRDQPETAAARGSAAARRSSSVASPPRCAGGIRRPRTRSA